MAHTLVTACVYCTPALSPHMSRQQCCVLHDTLQHAQRAAGVTLRVAPAVVLAEKSASSTRSSTRSTSTTGASEAGAGVSGAGLPGWTRELLQQGAGTIVATRLDRLCRSTRRM